MHDAAAHAVDTVAVAGTEGYEEFLRKRLYKLRGVRHSRSTFVLRRLKHTPSVEP